MPLLVSCRDDATRVTQPELLAAESPAIDELVELTVPTYDGSGQAVHPDIVAFPRTWNGARYWLTMTPYPGSDERYENPSVLVSDDGQQLRDPAIGINPLVATPDGREAYNSDPDLVYDDATDRLVLFYRQVKDGRNAVGVVSSADGHAWRAERDAFSGKSHDVVSPTVVPRTERGPALAWYVASGTSGCSARATAVMMRRATNADAPLASATWGNPVRVSLQQPRYNVWHIKVRYIPALHEYWALYSAYRNRDADCQSDDLFFARSPDGVQWKTYAQPLIRHGTRPWTSAAIYRSTFLYDPASDEMRIWLSAKSRDGTWHMGYTKLDMSRAIEQILLPVTQGSMRPRTYVESPGVNHRARGDHFGAP